MSTRVRPWRLMLLLVRFRLRHTLNGFRRGGTSGSRWVTFAALLLPLTYVGLFVSAFGVVAAVAPWPVQVATLVVVAWGLTLASLVSKLTGGDAIVAGTAENEFYMARPLDLATLVVARALASAVLDFWGALFLFPVLAAVAYLWHLGALGFVVAGAISVTLQVILVGIGQCVGLGLLGRASVQRRRTLATVFGLLSALSVATLWALASFVLRQPEHFVRVVTPFAAHIAGNPLALIVQPLLMLHAGDRLGCGLWLLLLTALAAVFVWVASRVASMAARSGWQDAGVMFEAVPAANRQRGGPALSVAGKELRLLVRDRARLVALLAMPFLFVGVQVFGAAGMEAFAGGPARAGLLAYSLAAYLATLGPLPHMQGERRAFWILRSVPVPLQQIMWGKVKAWLWVIVGVGVVAFVATVAVGGSLVLNDPVLWRTFALVVAGSALVCTLAIGVGCSAADLSDEGRNALGPASVYVFLLVAGLFNVSLLRDGALAWRTLALYAATVALVWATGVRRAETALDAGRLRPLTPGDGALATVVLFCGVHLISLAPAGLTDRQAAMVRAGWAALVAAVACAFMWSVRRGLVRKGAGVLPWFASFRGRGWLRVGGATVISILCALLQRFVWKQEPVGLAMVLAEEVVFRALLQRALQQHFVGQVRGRFVALAVAIAIASVATITPWSTMAFLTQAIAVLAFAAGRSIVPAVLGRMSMFVFD